MCKGLSIDDVGVSRDTVFQVIRPGGGFETGEFVEEKLGGGYRRTTRWCYVFNVDDTVATIVGHDIL